MKTVIFLSTMTIVFYFLWIEAPEIKKATPYDNLQVSFSEPMDSSVLIPENYAISYGLSVSATPIFISTPPVVSWVEFTNDSTVICFTTPHIRNQGYKVSVTNVRDTAGNLINEFNFAYYVGN